MEDCQRYPLGSYRHLCRHGHILVNNLTSVETLNILSIPLAGSLTMGIAFAVMAADKNEGEVNIQDISIHVRNNYQFTVSLIIYPFCFQPLVI